MSSFVTRNKFGRPKRVIALKENNKGFPTGYYKKGVKVIQVQYSANVGEKGEEKGYCGYVTLTETDFNNNYSRNGWKSYENSGL